MINAPKEIDVFYKLIMSSMEGEIRKLTELQETDLLLNIQAIITGENDLKSISGPHSKFAFIGLLAHHLNEISDTFETLAEIERLHRARLPLPKEISLARFRKFLKESHLDNFYILHQRLDAFISVLIRAYSGAKFERFRIAADRFRKEVQEETKGIMGLRGTHVHETRFSNFTSEFKRIQFLELLTSSSKSSHLKSVLREAQREHHKFNLNILRHSVHISKFSLIGLGVLLSALQKDDVLLFPPKYNET